MAPGTRLRVRTPLTPEAVGVSTTDDDVFCKVQRRLLVAREVEHLVGSRPLKLHRLGRATGLKRVSATDQVLQSCFAGRTVPWLYSL